MAFPTVKATRAFKALHGTHVHEFVEAQVIEGELAEYLAATGAPVKVVGQRARTAPAASADSPTTPSGDVPVDEREVEDGGVTGGTS